MRPDAGARSPSQLLVRLNLQLKLRRDFGAFQCLSVAASWPIPVLTVFTYVGKSIEFYIDVRTRVPLRSRV